MNQTSVISNTLSVRSKMLDMLIPLLFLLPIIYYLNGLRAIVVIAVSVVSAVLTEAVWNAFRKKKSGIKDLSAIVTGLVIAYLLPSGVPLWMPLIGGIFAIAVVKMPFGGNSNSPFNPAAAAIAFLTVCWPDRVFGYDAASILRPFTWAATPREDYVLSAAGYLKQGAIPSESMTVTEMLFGNVPGAIGATAMFVIVACCIFLIYRRVSLWMVPASFLAACALVALLIPRSAAGGLSSVIYELMSGSILFCAVFLATDPVTAPKKFAARIVYGAAAGFLTMFFRHSIHPGAFEEGACFAIILVNATSKSMDKMVWKLTQKVKYSITHNEEKQTAFKNVLSTYEIDDSCTENESVVALKENAGEKQGDIKETPEQNSAEEPIAENTEQENTDENTAQEAYTEALEDEHIEGGAGQDPLKEESNEADKAMKRLEEDFENDSVFIEEMIKKKRSIEEETRKTQEALEKLREELIMTSKALANDGKKEAETKACTNDKEETDIKDSSSDTKEDEENKPSGWNKISE